MMLPQKDHVDQIASDVAGTHIRALQANGGLDSRVPGKHCIDGSGITRCNVEA